VLQQSDNGYRKALGQIARRLRTLKALKAGITEARATDVLWFYMGREPWHLLVSDLGWSWDEVEEWLLAQTTEALVGS
jgi:hypothetical protein